MACETGFSYPSLLDLETTIDHQLFIQVYCPSSQLLMATVLPAPAAPPEELDYHCTLEYPTRLLDGCALQAALQG